MAGAQRPDRGAVCARGRDLAEQPRRARRAIGWLPERAPLWPELDVREHLDAHALLRGLRGAAVRKRRDALLERLQLEREARRLVAVLSQGQRQRVGLACALLHEPALLVLDEPGNGLDPLQAAQLRELIRERAAAGCGVVLSTHLLPEVTAVCDRVAIMHEGRLRHDAPCGRGTAAADPGQRPMAALPASWITGPSGCALADAPMLRHAGPGSATRRSWRRRHAWAMCPLRMAPVVDAAAGLGAGSADRRRDGLGIPADAEPVPGPAGAPGRGRQHQRLHRPGHPALAGAVRGRRVRHGAAAEHVVARRRTPWRHPAVAVRRRPVARRAGAGQVPGVPGLAGADIAAGAGHAGGAGRGRRGRTGASWRRRPWAWCWPWRR